MTGGPALLRVIGAAIVAALLPGAVPAGAADRQLRFISERVTLDIAPGRLTVIGEYVFGGSRPEGGAPILYPFLTDSTLGEPQVARVEIAVSKVWQPLAWSVWPDGLRFTLPAGEDSCKVKVAYTQELRGQRAGYLLRSTAAWGIPLETARLVVRVNRGILDPKFNYPFHESAESEGRRTFTFDATPFMPTKDLEVEWGPEEFGP